MLIQKIQIKIINQINYKYNNKILQINNYNSNNRKINKIINNNNLEIYNYNNNNNWNHLAKINKKINNNNSKKIKNNFCKQI